MNKAVIILDDIRSYQTLVYKNGSRTFMKKDYLTYKEQLNGLREQLKHIEADIPIKLNMRFNVMGGVAGGDYSVKNDNGRTIRRFKTISEAEVYKKDNQYIEYNPIEIKYGVVGDNDNIQKPIVDYLEELEIIANDRFVTHINTSKTFGNNYNSIEIELIVLDMNNLVANDYYM